MRKIAFLPVAFSVMALICSCGNSSDKTSEAIEEPDFEQPVEVVNLQPEVYCNAYDGFVNMRSEPNYKASVVGKFQNGPEGASLISEEDGWSYIEYSGIVGYVASKYLQSTPTVKYTGSVTADWVEGIWIDTEEEKECGEECAGVYYIFSNGYYSGPWYEGGDDSIFGRWQFQNNELVLYKMKDIYWISSSSCTEKECGDGPAAVLAINASQARLGNLRRVSWDYDGYNMMIISKDQFKLKKKEIAKEF